MGKSRALVVSRPRTRTVVVRSRSRKKTGTTIPIAIMAGMAPLALDAISAWKSTGSIQTGFEHVTMGITGYNPADRSFSPRWALEKFYMPMALGMLTHKIANKMGVNRALGKAGVPFIRI